MSELVTAATGWIEGIHPHHRHLTRALEILLELAPDAGEALQVATVTHDSERAIPDPDPPFDSARHFAVPGYLRFHQRRAAAVTGRWLDDSGVRFQLRERVTTLIAVHEEGGWPEADLLQAADSLSFLETMVSVVEGWVTGGRAGPDVALAKLQWMHDRIDPGLSQAQARAVPLLQAGRERVLSVSNV